MNVYPAIDLLDGRVVRLERGDASRATEYGSDPAEVAERFCRAGARLVHVVDLSGAFAGAPAQRPVLAELIARVHAAGGRIQISGGLRTREAAEAALAAGADRIVVGTMAVEDPDTAADLCRAHPGRIVVAVDARDGLVATRGWRTTTSIPAAELARTAEAWGAAALLFTDVARDGTGRGPAVEATAALQREVEIPVIASGGVGSLEDVRALERAGVRAVVIGRAIYEGLVSLEEVLAAC